MDKKFYAVLRKDTLIIKGKKTFIIRVNRNLQLKIGEQIVDEYGTIFTISGIAMIHFPAEIPQWYKNETELMLKGTASQIGNFISKIEYN